MEGLSGLGCRVCRGKDRAGAKASLSFASSPVVGARGRFLACRSVQQRHSPVGIASLKMLLQGH